MYIMMLPAGLPGLAAFAKFICTIYYEFKCSQEKNPSVEDMHRLAL